MGKPSVGGNPHGNVLGRGFVQRGYRASEGYGRGSSNGGNYGRRKRTLDRERGDVSWRAAAVNFWRGSRWVAAADGNGEQRGHGGGGGGGGGGGPGAGGR